MYSQAFDRLVEVDGQSGSKAELCDRLAQRKEANSQDVVMAWLTKIPTGDDSVIPGICNTSNTI